MRGIIFLVALVALNPVYAQDWEWEYPAYQVGWITIIDGRIGSTGGAPSPVVVEIQYETEETGGWQTWCRLVLRGGTSDPVLRVPVMLQPDWRDHVRVVVGSQVMGVAEGETLLVWGTPPYSWRVVPVPQYRRQLWHWAGGMLVGMLGVWLAWRWTRRLLRVTMEAS